MSEVRGSSREELPCIRGRGGWEKPSRTEARGGDPEEPPEPEARGGDPEKPPRAQGQGRQLGGATHARGQGLQPGGVTQGVVAAQAQEGPEELSHIEGQERW